MKRLSVLFALFAAVTVFALSAQEPSGLQIMQEVYERPTGHDLVSDLTMTLTNSRGETRERKVRQFRKEFKDGERKVMFFLAPADVKDTSFMSWSWDAPGKDDDQWIYLPALKRVKRISRDSKSDYFMGSDFTYDDLGERHPSEDTHRLLGTETIEGETVYLVESVPKQPGTMYSRTVSWVVKDKWVGLKKEFFDPQGRALKTLAVKKYDRIDGFWVLLEFEMENVQKKHRTTMRIENVAIDRGLDDGLFTERMMQRGGR
jgi:outer membrane lipoprotein-sorting protein